MLSKNSYKCIITVFFILALLISKNSYAVMPNIDCKSTCPHTPSKYRSEDSLPTHAHCIQVDGNKIYYRTEGAGTPTMIFSSGTGFPSDGWFESGIASEMAKKSKSIFL